jgi:hypothetical protein
LLWMLHESAISICWCLGPLPQLWAVRLWATHATQAGRSDAVPLGRKRIRLIGL